MLKLFICKVCGEPHLSVGKPTECQFCGAPHTLIGAPEEYKVIWGAELTQQEKDDMKATLNLEVGATAFYRDCAKAHEKYGKYERLFKGLARVEKEHAEVAAKFLDIPLPEFTGEKSRGTPEGDLQRTKELETHATEMYELFLSRASCPQAKDFFTALVHAEAGHRDHAIEELK